MVHPPTIGDTLTRARRRLAEASFSPSTREAALLLGWVLGLSEAQVEARWEDSLSPTELDRFESALEQRLAGEPVAYIVGSKEFFGRSFTVDAGVLIPRPETEHLVETALELPLPERPRIVDIGTGSGCIAITLALELPGSRLLATDISLDALAVARRNRMRLDGDQQVTLLATDLATGIDLTRIDLVVSNPPYVGTNEVDELSVEILDFEPAGALFAGLGGELFQRRLLNELIGLRAGSWLLIEIGAGQRETLERCCVGSSFELVGIRDDYAGRPRIAQLCRR